MDLAGASRWYYFYAAFQFYVRGKHTQRRKYTCMGHNKVTELQLWIIKNPLDSPSVIYLVCDGLNQLHHRRFSCMHHSTKMAVFQLWKLSQPRVPYPNTWHLPNHSNYHSPSQTQTHSQSPPLFRSQALSSCKPPPNSNLPLPHTAHTIYWASEKRSTPKTCCFPSSLALRGSHLSLSVPGTKVDELLVLLEWLPFLHAYFRFLGLVK